MSGQWHLMAFASVICMLQILPPRLQLLHRNAGISLFNHCSHAGHLEWIDSPQQWFKVTLKPYENRSKTAQGTPHHKQVCGYSASAERLFCRVTWFPKTIKPVPRAERSWCHSDFTHNAKHPTTLSRNISNHPRLALHASAWRSSDDCRPGILVRLDTFGTSCRIHRYSSISITVTMNEWFGKTCRIQKLPQLNFTILHLWRTRTFIVIIFFQLNNLKPSAHGNITVSRNYDSARGS